MITLVDLTCIKGYIFRHRFLLIWVVIAMAGLSCGRTNHPLSYELKYELIHIPIRNPYLSNYANLFDIMPTDSGEMMAAFNHKTGNLDFFNLTHKTIKYSLPLESEGPDGISNGGLIVLDSDAFIMNSFKSYIRMSYDAKALSKVSITTIKDSTYFYDGVKEYSISPKGMTLSNFLFLSYDREHHEIIHPIFPMAGDEENRYSGYIGCSISLQDSSIKIIPIPYPEIFKKTNFDYGNLSHPNLLRNGDLIIYNFPCRSNVYTYNIKTGEQKEYNPRSHYTKNEAEPMKDLSPQGKFNYAFRALRFNPLLYIKKYDVYARVHYDSQSETNVERPGILMILNAAFEIVQEYKLPDNFSNYGCTDHSLYFFIFDKENDDSSLRLAKIDLEAIL